ncbi:MAG TPA: response regulator [Gemmataceae bacterium]|nr:response regulator [Gemmataceae bacterium]
MTRVLVVEDSPTQAQQLACVLEDAGFEVDTVADAEQGLATLTRTRFELVLSDLMLPGMSGFDLCRRIKADREQRCTPVVLLTARADPVNVLRGLEAGADGFITKGREPAEIVRRLRAVLARPARTTSSDDGEGSAIAYLDQQYHIAAPREQLLEVLLLAFEDQVQLDKGRQEELKLRKRAERELCTLNRELEKRVLERTAELAKVNHDLAQKNQENELFVYSASHDLRSPLVNLDGFTQELSQDCRQIRAILAGKDMPSAAQERGLPLLDTNVAESIQFIQASVSRLSTIIDALLSFSRVGRIEYTGQRVDVGAIVARIVKSMSSPIAERGATVTVKSMAPVWSDPAAVEQIFTNLIDNALNFLNPIRSGFIEIGTVDHAQADDKDSPSAPGTFYVRDNGVGIPEAFRAKVFKAFERLRPGAVKGDGMGLTFVQRIVERLGGRIWLESVEGEGTTFFVTLPGPPVPPARKLTSAAAAL